MGARTPPGPKPTRSDARPVLLRCWGNHVLIASIMVRARRKGEGALPRPPWWVTYVRLAMRFFFEAYVEQTSRFRFSRPLAEVLFVKSLQGIGKHRFERWFPASVPSPLLESAFSKPCKGSASTASKSAPRLRFSRPLCPGRSKSPLSGVLVGGSVSTASRIRFSSPRLASACSLPGHR